MKRIVIIGGGLGGLTAGALLARHGYQVVLIEQHTKVGGAATTFKRKDGFTVEVGLHEMDAVHLHPGTREIFEALGVYKHVGFVKVNEFFRVTATGFDFTMPDGRPEAIAALKERYPSETTGIDRYFDLIDALTHDMERIGHARWWQLMLFPVVYPTLFKYRKRAVREVLDEMIDSEELKLVLNANIGYFHTIPDSFSILYHAYAQSYYYRGGGWYIKGGSQKLSDYLASIITDNGGEVLTRSEAIALEVCAKVARSVTYRCQGKTVTIEADAVVSNLSPTQTYALAAVPYTEKKETANSLLTVYLGFSRSLKSLYGNQAYSRFFFPDVANIDDYDVRLNQDITKRGFVFVDYSQIDSGLCESGKSLATICSTDFLPEYENMGEEDYKHKKQDIIESYLGLLEKHYPGMRDLVEYVEVGTPRSIKRYLKTPEGTAYGFAPSAKQFFRQAETRSNMLKNLYFVGAWVVGGGFTPCIGSGALCYRKITGRKSL